MELTSKQRLTYAIRGQEVDHVPFAPFLAYYFDFLPETVQKKGQAAYLKEMGADVLLRGFGSAYQIKNSQSVKTEKIQGNKKYVTISTNKGALHLEYTYVKEANTWFLTKHPVEDLEDLYILKEYYSHMEVTETHEKLNAFIREIGESGLVIPIIGTADMKSSYQSLLETWVGTENLIYLTEDYPDEIMETLQVMEKTSMKTVEALMQSDAEFCLSWEDSSTGNISPALYREYIAPEISRWIKRLAEKNIGYVQHACGLIKDLLPDMAGQGITAVESITPPETGNVTMEEAVKLLPQNVSMIGGIDPVFFLNASVEELEAYAKEVLTVMKGRGFVLSNSDSCPPGVSYEKFVRLAQLVREI